MRNFLFSIIFVLAPTAVFATDWAAVKTLKCFFDSAANYDGENIDISQNPFGKSELIIDSIDLKKNTARAIGNAGGDDALIISHDPMFSACCYYWNGQYGFYNNLPNQRKIFNSFITPYNDGQSTSI